MAQVSTFLRQQFSFMIRKRWGRLFRLWQANHFNQIAVWIKSRLWLWILSLTCKLGIHPLFRVCRGAGADPSWHLAWDMGRTYKLLTEKGPDLRIKPWTFCPWGNSTNHCTTVSLIASIILTETKKIFRTKKESDQ